MRYPDSSRRPLGSFTNAICCSASGTSCRRSALTVSKSAPGMRACFYKIPVTDALVVANVCKFVRWKRDKIRLYIVFRACGSLLCEITVQRPNHRAQRQRAGRAPIFAGRDAVSRTEHARERLLRGKTAVERDIKQPLFSVPNRGRRACTKSRREVPVSAWNWCEICDCEQSSSLAKCASVSVSPSRARIQRSISAISRRTLSCQFCMKIPPCPCIIQENELCRLI